MPLSFDHIVLGSRLLVAAKNRRYRSVSMLRQGPNTIRHLKIDGCRFTDCKLLVGSGTSLASLSEACRIHQPKMKFPWR